jgi:hypothetical protein
MIVAGGADDGPPHTSFTGIYQPWRRSTENFYFGDRLVLRLAFFQRVVV